MPKLCQIVALVTARKGKAQSALAECQARVSKSGLLDGLARQYQPREEDGERFPSESKQVQVKALESFDESAREVSEVLDLVLTQEAGNTQALGSIILDAGYELASNLPVSYLLYLEKALKEIERLIQAMPTLDPADKWGYDGMVDCYATDPYQTIKTKKVMKNHVKAPATDKHPAQVETYTEDIIVGYWTNIKMSGAIPASEKNAMLGRVKELQDSVKVAREEANSLEIKQRRIGEALFDYIRGRR